MKLKKNEQGHHLDGSSMKSLLENPTSESWIGDRPALTVVFAGPLYKNMPQKQHYAIRTDRFRYILYNNGKEELYDHQNDPHEWNNLVLSEKNQEKTLINMRQQLAMMLSPIELEGLKNKNNK